MGAFPGTTSRLFKLETGKKRNFAASGARVTSAIEDIEWNRQVSATDFLWLIGFGRGPHRRSRSIRSKKVDHRGIAYVLCASTDRHRSRGILRHSGRSVDDAIAQVQRLKVRKFIVDPSNWLLQH